MNRTAELPSNSFFQARAYGRHPEDLQVDFEDPLPPRVTTEVLSRCLRRAGGEPYPGREIWSWTLKQRLQGLLAVAVATLGRTVTETALCSHCGQQMDMDINWTDFHEDFEAAPFDWEPEPGLRMRLRLPTGQDQLELFGEGAAAQDWPLQLARRLSAGDEVQPDTHPEIKPDWLDSFSELLAEQDPLTVLFLKACCPSCGSENSIDLDLEQQILRRLRGELSGLMWEVHQLAGRYHWSESEILALPPWRRRHYLRMLKAEGWS